MTYSQSHFQSVTAQRSWPTGSNSSHPRPVTSVSLTVSEPAYKQGLGETASDQSEGLLEAGRDADLLKAGEPVEGPLLTDTEKFELLSAYLDGEVSDQEGAMVEGWIANNPEINRLYHEQLKLREAMRSLPLDLLWGGNVAASRTSGQGLQCNDGGMTTISPEPPPDLTGQCKLA